jgi:SAM-dependent methyltransferase
MAETTRAHKRRTDLGYFDTILVGKGLDIGAGDDPITPDCDIFEKSLPDNGTPPPGHKIFIGDAHRTEGIDVETYDFVYASHVLEHLDNPICAIQRWFEVLRHGGYLFITVPHRDYYERSRTLPSRWNADHKCYWIPYGVDPPATFGLWDVITEALDSIVSAGEWSFVQEPVSFVSDSDRFLPKYMHAENEYSIETIVQRI